MSDPTTPVSTTEPSFARRRPNTAALLVTLSITALVTAYLYLLEMYYWHSAAERAAGWPEDIAPLVQLIAFIYLNLCLIAGMATAFFIFRVFLAVRAKLATPDDEDTGVPADSPAKTPAAGLADGTHN